MEHRDMIQAVGVWFYARDTQRNLYLMRRDARHPHCWALPGGKIDDGENLLEAIQRECREELGMIPQFQQLAPIEKFTTASQEFCYHTFFCSLSQEFQPRLNHEHLGYAWIAAGVWPRPMHPGLWNMVNLDEIAHKVQLLQNH